MLRVDNVVEIVFVKRLKIEKFINKKNLLFVECFIVDESINILLLLV